MTTLSRWRLLPVLFFALLLLLGGRPAPVTADELPKLSINDMGVYEGSSGLTPMLFLVSLSAPSTQTVTVDYVTRDGNAIAGEDYGFGRGHLTFAPGETGRYFRVWIKGDTKLEADEGFLVELQRPVNAAIEKAAGVALIINDEQAIIGGKSLRLRPALMELSWEPGTAQTGYVITRIDMVTGVSKTIGPLDASARSYRDAQAPILTMFCYMLTPITGGDPIGLSDKVCGQSGITSGVKAPLNFSIALDQSTVANLAWSAPNQGVEVYVLAVLSLAGLPTEYVALPGDTESFSHETGGQPTCYLLVGIKGELGGMADPVCAVSGNSSLGTKSAGAFQASLTGLDITRLTTLNRE